MMFVTLLAAPLVFIGKTSFLGSLEQRTCVAPDLRQRDADSVPSGFATAITGWESDRSPSRA